MSIEADIVTGLQGHAGLFALIGVRLRPDKLEPGETMPAVVYQGIDSPYEQSFDRSVAARLPRFQFTAWADSRKDAYTVREQLKDALIALTGDTVTINGLQLVDGGAGYNDDTKHYSERLDAIITYQG